MNRIEERMALLQEKQKKALITYMTAGLPDMEGTKALIRAQEETGVDVIELGVPFSDPVADGPVIQNASYRSICQGTNLKQIFQMMEELRSEGVNMPIAFMMYYNTILHYGVENFAAQCKTAGVDGVIVPDLPFEEQGTLKAALQNEDAAILIQLVSPVSKDRIKKILDGAKGFVSCVSSMDVTGQGGTIQKEVLAYLREVKAASSIPVMMDFGVRTPEDTASMKEIVDGVIVGAYFMQMLEEQGYRVEAAKEFCGAFQAK